MTVEAELAQLLIRIGTERGLDIETILSEMAQAPLPSFVDANAVRGSMLEAVESWWRADLEERLGQLRRQFQLTVSPGAPAGARPAAPPVAPPGAISHRPAPGAKVAGAAANPPAPAVAERTDDANMQEEAEPALNESSEALPSDATMIWNTNHG